MQELRDRVAVITGAASGIGYAMARRFAAEGMKIVAADIEQDAVDRAAGTLRAEGATVLAVRTDVSRPEEVEALAQRTVDAFGAVHLVCNNAGVGALRRRAWEASVKDWQWVLGVNLWGVIHGVRTFIPRMLAQDCECHMVNTGSVAGLLSTSGMSVYNVSKHGVVTLTETLYHDLAQANAKIGVSLLLPAWVSTGIWNSARNRPAELREAATEAEDASRSVAIRDVLQKGKVTADDVAALVCDAVRANRFYVMTHPRIRQSIDVRLQDFLQDRNPTFTN